MPKVKAPEFSLPATDGTMHTLESFSGSWLILYFYPKDSTGGCTREAVDFTAQLPLFTRMNAVVVGVSPDSCSSHQKFIEKHHLTVTLLSDSSRETLEHYGVWQKKMLYGKEYMGVVRTTLLIDPKGFIRKRWDKVSVEGHAEEVLEALKSEQSA